MRKYIMQGLITVFTIFSVHADNTDKNKLIKSDFAVPDLSSYNIVWDKVSNNPSESMPLGGGDIGCNVWVESGEILLYAQRSGCFSENGEYLKLGRVRLALTPNPFSDYEKFKQELKLKDGYIVIESQNTSMRVKLNLWVDIFTHSIHIDIESDNKIEVTATYESWRTENRELTDKNRGRFGCFGLEGFPGKVIKMKDEMEYAKNGVLFYHRNAAQTLSPDIMIEQQGLTAYKDEITNNIKNLTFGGFLYGNNFEEGKIVDGIYYGTPFRGWQLKSSKSAKKHHLMLASHIEQTTEFGDWEKNVFEAVKEISRTKGNFKKNNSWWNDFWKRSWIITNPLQKPEDKLLWEMGRNYQLFRYQLGCNLYGDYPSKFNGGNFTFDPALVNAKMQHDPDWRQWGGDVFTAQNQRLLYWPMLKSGDFDGMKSQFNLYEWGLKGAMLKVEKFFGHKGAIYCEYANSPGLDIGKGWGWEKANMRLRGKEIPFGDPQANASRGYNDLVEEGVMANPFISYHWESQVEHAYMMLEKHRFTGENINRYMPFIKNALIFFDEHYQKREQMRNERSVDENGKLVIYPSTSCESYRGAKNPADLVSGIRSCLEALIEIESDAVTKDEKKYYKEYLERLPGLYYEHTANGVCIIKPAESYSKYINVECPQFYPLFPFNRYDIKSDMIPIFRDTWKHSTFPKDNEVSWHQDGIFYARMGMVEKAIEYNLKKLKNAPYRFPTFWGPGHDWVPDHNWGGSGMIGLQEMLLQTVGNKIHILPAWPKNKDVSFRLHAPQNTVVEVEYIDGKLKTLKVVPESRKKDIEILLK